MASDRHWREARQVEEDWERTTKSAWNKMRIMYVSNSDTMVGRKDGEVQNRGAVYAEPREAHKSHFDTIMMLQCTRRSHTTERTYRLPHTLFKHLTLFLGTHKGRSAPGHKVQSHRCRGTKSVPRMHARPFDHNHDAEDGSGQKSGVASTRCGSLCKGRVP